MGALTDTRKRCFVDLFSSSPSLKKPRSSQPTLSVPPDKPTPSPPPPLPPQPKPSRFPPTAPLRRPVQGPQRNIRVFGIGKLPAIANPMGNWASQEAEARGSWGKRKSLSAAPVRDGDGGSGEKNMERSGMKLDEYKRLVEGLQQEPEIVQEPIHEVVRGSDAVAVCTPSTGDGLSPRDVKSAEGKCVEPMGMVVLESTPAREDVGRSRTSPLYKDLLEESARKHDSELSRLDFEINLFKKKISAIRIESEERPEEEKDGPFATLTEEDESNVRLALEEPERFSQLRDVLVMHEESNIEITRESIHCLRPGAWLNDEVINLYFDLLKEREKRNSDKFLKCHFFNTFFYKKLTSGQDGYDFKAVRRWTTQRKIGYSLIECDKIFVPIHKEIHWCLAVINIKEEKFQYLDSLGKMDRAVLNVLARYLVDEVKDKSNRVIDLKFWKREFVDNLPLQKNGWDCGVFMIKYADFFSRGMSLTFSQEHMGYFRRRTVKEILRLRAD